MKKALNIGEKEVGFSQEITHVRDQVRPAPYNVEPSISWVLKYRVFFDLEARDAAGHGTRAAGRRPRAARRRSGAGCPKPAEH